MSTKDMARSLSAAIHMYTNTHTFQKSQHMRLKATVGISFNFAAKNHYKKIVIMT